MVSKNITSSARFIKMPAETQALYFHLCISADDDGVCEAFSIMRLTGSSEDNIKILHSKWFIKILNEELVSYITDRNEHNLLRADRKVDSVYKDLLLQIIPWIELLEPKQRSDRKNGTSQGQPKDGLGKGRVGNDSIVENNIDEKEDIPHIYSLEEKINEYRITYPASMIQSFLLYRTEKNSKWKERWQCEKFFEVGKRLRTRKLKDDKRSKKDPVESEASRAVRIEQQVQSQKSLTPKYTWNAITNLQRSIEQWESDRGGDID
jgi:hypothetical protein